MRAGCREALLRFAGSAEAFLALRRGYAASLAAVAATGYISGSGDRHLDNFLLHPATGALVPIDFGCAAGAFVPFALLVLMHLLLYPTGNMPCGEEFTLHHMPACRDAGCAAGCCTPCTAESWGPQCALRQVARRGRYSFGTGAQALPIPELVPFRLTRQLRGALQPHDACAQLAAPLARGLAALRAGRDALEVPRDAQTCNSASGVRCSWRPAVHARRRSASSAVLCMIAGEVS